jgi:hypothetical protein
MTADRDLRERYIAWGIRGLVFLGAALLLLTGHAFGWNVRMQNIQVPVQNYAVIDLNTAIPSAWASLISLDDFGDAAFAYTLGQTGQQMYVDTWSNGTAQDVQNFELSFESNLDPWFGPDGYAPYYYSYNPNSVTLSGDIYGEMNVYVAGAYWTTVNTHRSGFEASGGSITDLFPPSPLQLFESTLMAGPDGEGFDDGYYSMGSTNDGALWANGYLNQPNVPNFDPSDPYSYTYGPNISWLPQPSGNAVIFSAQPTQTFLNVAAANNLSIQSSYFNISNRNDAGWAIGLTSDTSSGIWNGQSLLSLGADIATDLNEQNQVVVRENAPGEGYLWENGSDTTLASVIPKMVGGQVYNAQPFSISNQASTETDATIHILATADNSGDAPPGGGPAPEENFLWQRDNSGHWTFFKAVLPQGTVIDDWTAINSSGVIAALGNPNSMVTNDHALLLLPVQLVNKADPTQRNGADGTDKQIDLMSSSTGTDINAVAWIAASDTTQAQVVTGVYPPRMPELVASSGSIPGLTYCWKLQVIFHDRNGNPHRDFDTGDPYNTNPSPSAVPQDTVTIPATSNSSDPNNVNGWHQITDGSPWNIYQDNDWINPTLQGFFGGDAELSLKILDSSGNTICPEQDYYFRIAGENPDPTVCQNYINTVYNGPTPNWQNVASTGTTTPPTVPGYWFAYAIAKEETDGDGGRTWYNNFLDNGGQYHAVPGKEGKPDWNNDGSTKNPTSGSGGYGLFQLTFQPGDANYIMPRDWIWNWQSNVQQFLPIAQQKLGYTQGYLNYIKANNASYFDPSSLTTTADTTTFNFWESSVITLNNGASVIVGPRGHRRAGAWTFNSGPPASWHYKANSKQYLYKVAYHGVENHP